MVKSHNRRHRKSTGDVYVKRSVLTGQPVFVVAGRCRHSAQTYYCKARRSEERKLKEMETAQRNACRDIIQKLLNDCVAELPLMTDMTPKQRAAAKNLHYLAKHPILPDRGFIDHCRTEKEINATQRPWLQHKASD